MLSASPPHSILFLLSLSLSLSLYLFQSLF